MDDNNYLIKLTKALFQTATSLKANNLQTQVVVNEVMEHILYYVFTKLNDTSNSVNQRCMLASEMYHALAPVFEPQRIAPSDIVQVPYDEGYYDDDYKYEYYKFYREEPGGDIKVSKLKSVGDDGYEKALLLQDRICDVVLMHLTLTNQGAKSKCVSFSTYRIN